MGPKIRWRDRARCIADAFAASMIRDGSSLWPVLAGVDGYLYPHEAVFLKRVAAECPAAGCIVEIGSFLGRSTLCLAQGAIARGDTVYAIDPHVYGTEELLKQNLARRKEGRCVRSVSQESLSAAAAWSEPIRLAFIDGAHDEENVRADLIAWYRHLVPGGCLLMHDSTDVSGFPGPRRVAGELMRTGERFTRIGRIGSITWGQVPGGAESWSPPARLGALYDRLILALKRNAPRALQSSG